MLFGKQFLRIVLAVVCLGTTGAMLDACPWFCCSRHRTTARSIAQKAAEQKAPLKQPQIRRVLVEPTSETVRNCPNCAQRFLDWLEKKLSRLISIKRLSNTKI
jgi:hypothetical protein